MSDKSHSFEPTLMERPGSLRENRFGEVGEAPDDVSGTVVDCPHQELKAVGGNMRDLLECFWVCLRPFLSC